MKSLYILIIAGIFMGCQSPVPYTDPKGQNSFGEYIHAMKLEYGLNLLSQKVEGKKAGFDFCHYGEAGHLEARFLIHNAAKELLKRSTLEEKEIAVTISFIDPTTHKCYLHDKVAIVSLLNGRIQFASQNPETGLLQEIVSEDYQSARQ